MANQNREAKKKNNIRRLTNQHDMATWRYGDIMYANVCEFVLVRDSHSIRFLFVLFFRLFVLICRHNSLYNTNHRIKILSVPQLSESIDSIQ